MALEVTRSQAGSEYRQTVRLAAGDGGHRVEVDLALDWRTPSTFSKLTFPLSSANPTATYDLGLGVIERGNNGENLYEVPAQQWADLSAPDGSFGVSVLNDCKYGWDKPDDETLRLTLLHTPFPFFISAYYGHDTQDIGPHRVLYGLYGYADDWRNGSVRQAKRLNQPLIALQTARHPGGSGGAQAGRGRRRVRGQGEGGYGEIAVRHPPGDGGRHREREGGGRNRATGGGGGPGLQADSV